MIRAIGDLVQNLTVALSLAVGVAAYSPWYVAVLVFCTIPIFIADSYFSLRWYSLKLSQTPVKRELDYLRQLATHRDSSKELRLFNLGDFLIRRYAEKSRKILNDDRKLQGRKLLGGSLAAVTTGGQYAIYVVLLSQAVLGVITLGTLLFVAGAVAGAARAIQEIFVAFSGIADQALFVTDLRVFLAEKPVVTANANARSVPRPLRQGFELRNVSFTYPRSERRVLDRVSFRIRPGERVALVGENGQGKTTVVKLLLRLYDPTEGQVLLDGIDLREYSIAELHAAAGVIFQDFVRYEMTVAENIGVGRVSGMNDERRLRQAAKWSGAEEIIERLPQGLHQKLGRRFYGGIDISGGEWQRIALARAYMRDAQFFILDEPTASLDAKAEREVFDHFADLTRGKMALLISHRFSTVKTADRILVLSGGKIIEDDDHQGLMARGGLYSRLFTLQAENFR
jgi:ATP-binding cassette subfamily B protein